MINRIFIIGDSFCDGILHPKSKNLPIENMHWVNYVDYHYEDTEIINDALGSRDIQSIIDYWIKLLPLLTENDRLIIGFPYLSRQRIPIENEKNYRLIPWSGGVCRNMFLTRQWWTAFNVFKTTAAHNYSDRTQKIWTEEKIDDIIEFLEIMNSTTTVAINYKEVIESLHKITPCKSYLFSWFDYSLHNIPKANQIEDKNDITNNIGIWTTNEMLYEETNGEKGNKNDFHWDYRTMKEFGNYVINKIK